MHPVFKVYPYANKSKKIVNRCVESVQNTEQSSYCKSKTAHLKAQNQKSIDTQHNHQRGLTIENMRTSHENTRFIRKQHRSSQNSNPKRSRTKTLPNSPSRILHCSQLHG
jgi:hypothetical protein